ncbi:glycoprotein [Klamath virus]|uniref:Glycoprotein n=1 Tax=Klamath virus TaxID=909206 RepID=A0A0D3R1L7_9RHAB|nr:glycoprotein [Klamath virus]AJR28402.1 glycoprotein [Klamath virus]
MFRTLFFSLLGLCTGLGNQDEGHTVVLPVQVPRNWKPATESDFTCNHPPQWEPDTPFVLLNAKMLAKQEPIQVRGWFCYKSKWTTGCGTNLLFSKSVTHKVTHLPVSEHECREAVDRERQGRSEPETFPDPVCAWMSDTTKDTVYTHVLPHAAQYDPRSNRLTSPGFPQGVCDNLRWCSATTPDRWWLPDSDLEVQKQLETHMDSVILKLFPMPFPAENPYVGPHSVVSGSRIPPTVVEGSCKLTLLGDEGIVLPTGIWLGIKYGDYQLLHGGRKMGKKLQVQQANLGFITKQCKAEDHRVIPTTESPFYRVQLSTLHYMQYQFCLESLDKLNNNQTLSRVDLSRFAPRLPGLGKVFQLRDSAVWVGMTMYEMAVIPTGDETSKDIIGYIQDSTEAYTVAIHWTDWSMGSNRVENGPNGIFRKTGKVYHPQGLYQDLSLDLELLLTHSVDIVRHPVLEHVKEIPQIDRVVKDQSQTTIHLNSGISHFWENFHWLGGVKDKVILGIVGVVSFVGTLIGGMWVCKSRKRDQKRGY